MAIASKLKKYLDLKKVKYKVSKHPVAYTAQEIAAAQHVPGKQVIKSVLVKADAKYVLAVLPAIHLIDTAKLKKVVKCKSLKIATEDEITKVIPDFEVGAMPPLGELYGLDVYADEALKEDVDIVFNAGSHTDTVKIRYKDFEKITKPKLASFGKHV